MKLETRNKVIMIDRFPPRKNKGLYIGRKNDFGVMQYYKVATFSSDICADEFEKMLLYFLESGDDVKESKNGKL